MTAIAKSLAEVGFRVARFEFAYMASRRTSSRSQAAAAGGEAHSRVRGRDRGAQGRGPLIIGGKSMGGRVASMIADERSLEPLRAALPRLSLPSGRQAHQLRTAHLAQLKTPTLIVQGTRDPFGTREEVSTYKLSNTIEILWLEDGDHDLRPRKAMSGFSMADHLKTMAAATAAWAAKIT